MVLKSLVKERQGRERERGPQHGAHGILVVDKPSGPTSHDVVARLRRVLGVRKMGHAGTLDPGATGLLPVCMGQATRVVEYLMDLPKSYSVSLKLGEETDTEDASGQVIKRHGLSGVTEEAVKAATMQFLGEVLQTPPMFSAIRKNGRRLYEYAREGKEVHREARTVTFYDICDLQYDFPSVSFSVRCSRGTYIRTLCRDIGRELGVGAHLTDLRRTESAGFTERDAHPLAEIEEMGREKAISLLVPMDVPLAHFEAAAVRSDRIHKVSQGQPLGVEDLVVHPDSWASGNFLRLYGADGMFLGIGTIGRSLKDTPLVLPRKVLFEGLKN